MKIQDDLSLLSQRFNLPLRYLEAASEIIVEHGYPDRMRLEDFVRNPWARHVETISPRTAEARGFIIRRMQHRVHVEVLPTLALGLQRVNNTILCRMPARSEIRGGSSNLKPLPDQAESQWNVLHADERDAVEAGSAEHRAAAAPGLAERRRKAARARPKQAEGKEAPEHRQEPRRPLADPPASSTPRREAEPEATTSTPATPERRHTAKADKPTLAPRRRAG